MTRGISAQKSGPIALFRPGPISVTWATCGCRVAFSTRTDAYSPAADGAAAEVSAMLMRSACQSGPDNGEGPSPVRRGRRA